MAYPYALSACQAQANPVQECLAIARYNLSKTAKQELLRLMMKKEKAPPLTSSPDEAKCLEMNLKLEWSQPRCRFYMREFESFRKSGCEWKSEPFYHVPNWNQNAGYKLQLGVYADGYGEAKGDSVSVFVYLLQGEYDSQLWWPVEVNTTVQLFDRRVQRPTHITKTISLKSGVFEGSGYAPIGLELPRSVVQTPTVRTLPHPSALMQPASVPQLDSAHTGVLFDSMGCAPHARSAKVKDKAKQKKRIRGEGSDLHYARYGAPSGPEYVKNDEAWFEVTTVSVRPLQI